MGGIVRVKAEQVDNPMHVRFATADRLMVDIYTGVIIKSVGAGAHIDRGTYRTYLPLGPINGGVVQLQGYFAENSVNDIAVIATPVSFTFPDTGSTVAIDHATASIRQEMRNGNPADQMHVLVLDADYAICHGRIDRVAYQVTVTTPGTDATLIRYQTSVNGDEAPRS